MITLYQFRPAWGLPNPSPFCFKTENYLRLAEIPFESKLGDPRKAPKGKLPYIKDEGKLIPDSLHIIEHLKKTRGDKLDANLTAEQRALGHVIRRTLEEGYFWTVVFARWIDPPGFALMRRDVLAPALPSLLRPILPAVIQRTIRKSLHHQGTGRHTRDDIYAIGKADLDALSALLGEKPYFLGDAPTSVDATTYAFLALTLWAPPSDEEMPRHIRALPNLVAYCERMKARVYPG